METKTKKLLGIMMLTITSIAFGIWGHNAMVWPCEYDQDRDPHPYYPWVNPYARPDVGMIMIPFIIGENLTFEQATAFRENCDCSDSNNIVWFTHKNYSFRLDYTRWDDDDKPNALNADFEIIGNISRESINSIDIEIVTGNLTFNLSQIPSKDYRQFTTINSSMGNTLTLFNKTLSLNNTSICYISITMQYVQVTFNLTTDIIKIGLLTRVCLQNIPNIGLRHIYDLDRWGICTLNGTQHDCIDLWGKGAELWYYF
jgi:hypothetical protein